MSNEHLTELALSLHQTTGSSRQWNHKTAPFPAKSWNIGTFSLELGLSFGNSIFRGETCGFSLVGQRKA
jgi:hypothetical protein